MKKFGLWLIFLVLGAGLICVPSLTLAASPAEKEAAAFYRGKTVEFVVPTPPGGGYDAVARMMQPFLAKHLGTTVIIINEPGASGKKMMNRLAKENDGLSIFTGVLQALVMAQIFGEEGTRFDLAKFNWLGTVTQNQFVLAMGKKSGFKSIPDLQQAKIVKFGADDRAGGFASRPLLVSHVLGINGKVITGYKGTSEVLLSVLRGETDGISGSLQGAMLSYIQSQDLLPLLVTSHKRFKLLPDTPTIYEVKILSAKEKKIVDLAVSSEFDRPVATTPGVPKERVAFLQSAFLKTLQEPELIKRFEKFGTPEEDVSGIGGKEVLKAINELLSLKGEEKALIGKFMGAKGY